VRGLANSEPASTGKDSFSAESATILPEASVICAEATGRIALFPWFFKNGVKSTLSALDSA
jgi:hypothetical protein